MFQIYRENKLNPYSAIFTKVDSSCTKGLAVNGKR